MSAGIAVSIARHQGNNKLERFILKLCQTAKFPPMSFSLLHDYKYLAHILTVLSIYLPR